jgi:hypothetical protein
MYPRIKPSLKVAVTSRYLITGFDGAGNVLFSVSAEGITEADAQRLALCELHKTSAGSERADKAEKIVTELRWRAIDGSP